MRPLRILAAVLASTTAVVGAVAVAGSASGDPQDIPRAELAQVRAATAQFHDVEAATAAGYELLPDCFDSPDGGMGIHYLKGVANTQVDALAPEALVYEVTKHGPKLVAVEYIVPKSLSNEPPTVLGQTLHANDALGLWVLHAWIWQPNPSGMFKDYNPKVGACPTS
jgi:hypothetical protein